MFEKFLSVKKINISEKSVWNELYKLNEKACEGKLEYKLRPKDKYGIDDIYNYALIETEDSKNPLVIVLVKFNNDSIFLDSFDVTKSCENRVSLNNLIGALRKTYKANVLFVFELDNKEKFKLCYYPLKINKNDIKAGISSLDSKINYDFAGVSITPWIHLDAQSRTIKTVLSKLNDLFEQAAKIKTDEFYLQVEEILKGISSDEIISVLTQEPISEKYRLSLKRLFAGLDITEANRCLSDFNLEESFLTSIPTISIKGNYHDVYEKVDVEDFWHLLHSNGVEEDDLTDVSYFNKNTSQKPVVSSGNDESESTNLFSFTSFKDLPEYEYNTIREAVERIESYEILDGEKMKLSNGSEFFLDLNVRQSVTFYEAIYLCNKKSIQDGLTPCYEFSNPKIDHNELVFDFSENNENGYRLPMAREIKEFLDNESVINKSSLSDKIKILSGNLYKETVIIDDKLNILGKEQVIKLEKIRKDTKQQCEEFGKQWLCMVLAYGQTLYAKLCSNDRKAFLQMVKNVPESDATKYRNMQNDLSNYLTNLTSIKRKSDLRNFNNQTETQKSKEIFWQPRIFIPARALLRTFENQKESIILSNDCLPKKQEKIEYSQEQISAFKNRLKEIDEQIKSLEAKMDVCNDIKLFNAYADQCGELTDEYKNIEKILKSSKNI